MNPFRIPLRSPDNFEWLLHPRPAAEFALAANDCFPPDLRVSPASHCHVPECRLVQIAADTTLHRRMSALRPSSKKSRDRGTDRTASANDGNVPHR